MKKSYDSKFKSRVALEAIRGEKSIAEIAGEYNIHPNLVAQWKKKLMEASSDVTAKVLKGPPYSFSCCPIIGPVSV